MSDGELTRRAPWVIRAVGCLLLGACLSGVGLFAAQSIGGQGPPRAARSVHLGYPAPEGELFYQEMVVEQSTPGSYFMACGWHLGYFGLQELADGRKVAIFSVWDPTRGDDPNAVKPEDRVEVLYQAVEARLRRFGGEGTGAQCMMDVGWRLGETNKFLVLGTVQGPKTAYAGYLWTPQQAGWKHLVTFRTGSGGQPLKGYYSFIEDFRRDTRSVDEVRRARLLNGWVRAVSGEWTALRQARFTASGAEWEAKENIEAGSADEAFYLVTGGSTQRTVELRAMIGLPASNRPAGLPALPARELLANPESP